MGSRTASARWATALGVPSLSVAALMLAGPAAPGGALEARASAADLTAPQVFGRPVVGHLLTGFPGVWTIALSSELEYRWRRCPPAAPCADIPGATTLVYTPAAGDVGMRLQLRVSASDDGVTEVRDSVATEAVTDRYGPGDTVSEQLSTAPASPPPLPARAARAAMIEPFPVVRIHGRLGAYWTRFTLVAVRAPAGTVITMRCSGRGCAFRTRRRTMPERARMRIPGLEHRFAPGDRLVLRVSASGRIGKYARIRVRRGRKPARWDGCVMPASAAPIACPVA